jgi:hypothetical protein
LFSFDKLFIQSCPIFQFQEKGVPEETIDASVSSPLQSGPSGPVIKKESFITKTVEKVKDSTTVWPFELIHPFA